MEVVKKEPQQIQPQPVSPMAAVERVLIRGDLAALTEAQRVDYYKAVCESVGLNPLTRPFDYIQYQGKLQLYATKNAAEQLRQIHKISLTITARETIGDLYVVTARAKDKTGREDESTGVIVIAGLRGQELANACMKCETKAKRRVTLSICGLGMLDEAEVADVVNESAPQQKVEAKPKEGPATMDDLEAINAAIAHSEWKNEEIKTYANKKYGTIDKRNLTAAQAADLCKVLRFKTFVQAMEEFQGKESNEKPMLQNDAMPPQPDGAK